MNSVKSLCSKAIIKADLKRYWWMGAIYSVLIFLFSVYPFLNSYWEMTIGDNVSFFDSRFCNFTQSVLFAVAIMAVVIGVFLFSYLHKSASVTSAHSYPIKRSGLYASHIASGLILMAGAILVNSIILMLCRGNENIYLMCSAKFVVIWTLLVMLYSVLAFSLSVLCSMVTGSAVAAFVLTYVIAAVPAFIEMIIRMIAYTSLKGFYQDGAELIVEKIYYPMTKLGDNYGAGIWLYIIITIAAFGLGMVFYKKRHLENHTAVLAFKSLKPVLIYSFGICLGFIGCLSLNAFRNSDTSLITMLPFGIIGVIIAKMLIGLTFKPKGVLKPIIIYTIFVFAFIGFFKFDISGFEKRIPDIDDIEWVSTNERYISDRSYRYINGEKLAYSDVYDAELKEKETIKQVTELHSMLTKYEYDEDRSHRSVFLCYKLKNGNMFKRQYFINDDFEGLRELFENEEYKKTLFTVLQDRVNIPYLNIGGSVFGRFYTPDSDMQKQILEALKKDAMLVTYDEYYNYKQFAGLNVNLTVEYKANDTSGKESKQPITDSEFAHLYESSVNTMALLRSLNITERAAESVKKMNIGKKQITAPEKISFVCERLLFESNVKEDNYDEIDLKEPKSVDKDIENGKYDGQGCQIVIDSDSTYLRCTQEEYNWLIS